MKLSQKEAVFASEVVTRFELYNSLFLTLPFYRVKHTGTLLPFFTSHCEESVRQNIAPADIIESFFAQYEQYVQASDRFDLLFRFIQYIERQVVLFDAIEDAAFSKTHTQEETGSIVSLLQQAAFKPALKAKLRQKLQEFSLRLVLTAHPTQFYPGRVLAIITDLTQAIKANNINDIHLLLQQLGKTPFFNKQKPTPVNEAASLAWFLENVFYYVVSDLQQQVEGEFESPIFNAHQLIELGFWPGGDRDGNPNVNSQTTKEVSDLLREILFRCYYRDFRLLKRRITFRGVEENMNRLQDLFYQNSFVKAEEPRDQQTEIIDNLEAVKDVLLRVHDGLFVDKIDDLIRKVRLFGCYFASLDIRQDSRVLRTAHQQGRAYANADLPDNYDTLSEEEKLKLIKFDEADIPSEGYDDLTTDTYTTIRLMKRMQTAGGENASHRFIISNCQQASDILQLITLFLWSGWKKDALTIDFVPLFETVQDLKAAGTVMERLYSHPFYKEHLKSRGNKQVIMLGFSDSTKDGGYLMANWSIYQAKVELTSLARRYGIELAFFDGRGGPPARGGGKTHRFYATMGREIANDHIQLTIQGQTISSQYGSFDSAHFNISQLVNAGVLSSFDDNNDKNTLTDQQKGLLASMASTSHKAFVSLREDPLFLKYLEQHSPLKLLSQINISSRPVKRNSGGELKLEDLRAISFVTAWTQLKQNIPGFYGVGSALKKAKEDGVWSEVKSLYEISGQFRTMMDNCIMSMSKADFRITAYLESDAVFGSFWRRLKDEFDLTRQLMLELTGTTVLLEQYPIERKSIGLRERIILPLVIIQHFALQQLESNKNDEETVRVLNKLIIRTVYGIVNAGRNVA
ncbi:phosphoenolpyruvate carboxylase [Pararcticibacter amylolyticus]|uniref:Phosphoenolpyruvate carboxylase n=1 Tax=Pararcticibacter amylolyticus TaxID=2173175 RepID=A0A2U2PKU7_9SPHI|nr:phosphoenolpyruvate carboxylase [Pararcticibacter amylolyticus]PWG82037.1 phosphoenolpyruvate carboxylase [Pararcticibacter amylolyticus]